MIVILSIFVVHFLADFVFQSSQMATNKSKSLKWLSIHVGVYGLVSLMTAFVISVRFGNYVYGFSWWIVNVALHFMVDYITSKVTSRLWEEKKTRLFFVMIGFDQLLHNICLVGTYYLLKSDLLVITP